MSRLVSSQFLSDCQTRDLLQRHIGEDADGWKTVANGVSHGAFLLRPTLCRNVACKYALHQYITCRLRMLADFRQARICWNMYIGYHISGNIPPDHVLHYACDVKQDSVVLYNIDMKTARQNMPQQKELENLAKGIETLLKLRGGDGS